MGDIDFENYVREILEDLRPGLTALEIETLVKPHRNAGYQAETDEAVRRYITGEVGR